MNGGGLNPGSEYLCLLVRGEEAGEREVKAPGSSTPTWEMGKQLGKQERNPCVGPVFVPKILQRYVLLVWSEPPHEERRDYRELSDKMKPFLSQLFPLGVKGAPGASDRRLGNSLRYLFHLKITRIVVNRSE